MIFFDEIDKFRITSVHVSFWLIQLLFESVVFPFTPTPAIMDSRALLGVGMIYAQCFMKNSSSLCCRGDMIGFGLAKLVKTIRSLLYRGQIARFVGR